MIIDIYCQNCKEHVLQADTDTLKLPLIGSMFTQKTGMEWAIFSPSSVGNDLICPMCESCFHWDDMVTTKINGELYTNKPEELAFEVLYQTERSGGIVRAVKSDDPEAKPKKSHGKGTHQEQVAKMKAEMPDYLAKQRKKNKALQEMGLE